MYTTSNYNNTETVLFY